MKETLFTSKVAAQKLSLNTSTLRKYATLLENYNYPIQRNSRGRIYSNQNIIKIEELCKLIQKGWSLVKAAESVTLEYQKHSVEELVENIIVRLEKVETQLNTITKRQ